MNTVEGLDRGVVGTRATIEKMHKLIAFGKLDPTIQKIATWIRMSVPQDQRGKTKATADAIFNWAKKHGIFKSDPFQVELIESPIAAMKPVIEARAAGTYRGPGLFTGDCDTYAIMVDTLGGILGFQYALETAKVDASRPDEFSHVWGALLVGNDWYALDASTPDAYPGWRPPVQPEQFARWPERPIESVVKGADMSAWNSRNGGLGDAEPDSDPRRTASPFDGVDAAYPADDFYAVPKDFGDGPGVIPPGNFEDIQLLPPHDTQIPAADLQPDMHYLKAAPRLDPSERVQSIDGQPDDHGNPYYRGSGRQPYYKVNAQPYPPGSRWNGAMGQDTVRYVRPNARYMVKSAESPEMKVRVEMAPSMQIRRRTILTTPRSIPFGTMAGMGDDVPGMVTDYEEEPTAPAPTASYPSPAGAALTVAPTPAAKATPTTQAQAQAGSSVWDSVAAAFKAVGTAVPSVMQSNLAKSVINATNKIAGRNILGVQTAAWYTNPFVLLLGASAVGGTAYVLWKRGSGGRRRRR